MAVRLIFVYGSLCSGEAAHSRLAGAGFVGEAWSRACYTLLDLGPYPGLVASGQTRVRGELYRVSAALVARTRSSTKATQTSSSGSR